MDKKLIDQTIETIMERGNPKYTTPSGAFIEFLRDLAQKKKVCEMSKALNIYCKDYPKASAFLSNRLPGILVNNYFTIQENLNYEKFMAFSISDREWANPIIENAFSPEIFTIEVEKVIEKSNQF
jgi:hypothetical protein